MGQFLGLGTGDEGSPPRSGKQSVQALGGLQADATGGGLSEKYAVRFRKKICLYIKVSLHIGLDSRQYEIMPVACEIRSMLQAWTRFPCNCLLFKRRMLVRG